MWFFHSFSVADNTGVTRDTAHSHTAYIQKVRRRLSCTNNNYDNNDYYCYIAHICMQYTVLKEILPWFGIAGKRGRNRTSSRAG